MNMEVMLSHSILLQLGWTLLHFVWQGTAIWLVAWLVLRILRHRSAEIRYALLLVMLGAMGSIPVATFWMLGNYRVGDTGMKTVVRTEQVSRRQANVEDGLKAVPSSRYALPPSVTASRVGGEEATRIDTPVTDQGPSLQSDNWLGPFHSWLDGARAWTLDALPLLVFCWATGVVVLALRIVGGWWTVHRLVTRQVQPLESQAAATAMRLVDCLHVRRPVRFLESAAAVVPMTVGWLRPVILLPASILTNLSAAELQCLLAHELVHIRRHDYLVNLLQCVLEVLLFYHPAVHWASRQIRNQRELICDDLAVRVTGDRMTYSRALLSVAQLACNPSPLALASSGGDLKARIQAIMLAKTDTQPTSLGVTSICLTLVLGGSVYLASTSAVPWLESANAQEANTSPGPASVGADSKRVTNSDLDGEMPYAPFMTPLALSPDLPPKFRLQPISGRVVDSSGASVAGAKVYLRASATWRAMSTMQPVATADLAVVTSADDGEFRFENVMASADDLRVDAVAISPGYALTWKHLPGGMALGDVELVLQPAKTIRGQVLGDDGQPIVGANVQLQHVMSIRHVAQADLEQGRWPRSDDPNYVSLGGCPESPADRTDANGRFTIDGLPSNRGHVLLVQHPSYKLQQAYAATVDQLDPENASRAKRSVQTGDVRVLLEKARRLSVQVVFDDTGKPAAGARYPDSLNQVWGQPRFVADTSGRFELSSLAGRRAPVQVFPPEGSDYLAAWELVEFDEQEYEKTHVVRLKRGAVVSGKVVDAETGKGINGVAVSYTPLLHQEGPWPGSSIGNQPVDARTTHDANRETDGAFRLVTLPGQIMIKTVGNAPGYHTSASNEVEGVANVRFEQTVQATLEQPVTEVVLRLPRTPVVQGIVYDDQGKTAPGVVITGNVPIAANGARSFALESDADGRFMLSELWNVSDYASELSLPIEVVFQDRSRDLAARLLLDAPKTPSDTEKSLEVRLQPVGTVTGRFVHADTGRPVPGVRVSIYRPVGTPDDYWRSAASEIRSDSDGCFRITGVLGGVGHFLSVTDGRYRWVNGLDYQFDGQYGQTHDFGDIELVPLDPPDEARLAPVSAPAIDGFGAEEAYELLVRKYEEDNTAYRELLDVSESRRMQTHVVERREPTPAYAEAFLRLADQQQGTDIELRALVWIASCPLIGGSYQRVLPLKKKAAQRLLDAYTDRKELVSCVDVLLAFGGQASSNSTEAAVATARRLLEENSHRDVQAWTCYGIAQQLVARHARPTDEDRKLAIDFLRRVTKQYSDVPYGHDDTLGAVAERALYELEHLTPGAVAPEIVGVDVDGHELRLSEFRGKMVVLNFWGSWCRPCIQKLDELRVISERYGDNVVVLGVMTDSPESARPAIQQHQVRFRNWIDGIERGPIASQWNVKAWPTVYVIDPLGVIRWKDADGGSLADAVWSLQRRTHSRH